MFYYIFLAEAAVNELFYSRFTFKISFFKGFWHGNSSSVKAILPLSATLPVAIGLKCFLFLITLLLYQSQPCLDYLSSIQQIFAYQTSFRENLDKSFLTYILNLMSKKILGSFNEANPSYACHDMNIFWQASFVKFPWHCWTELERLKGTLMQI